MSAQDTGRSGWKQMVVLFCTFIAVAVSTQNCIPGRSPDREAYIKYYAAQYTRKYKSDAIEVRAVYFTPERYLVANLDSSGHIDNAMVEKLKRFKNCIYFHVGVKASDAVLLRRMMQKKKEMFVVEPDIEMVLIDTAGNKADPVQILNNRFTHDENMEEYLVSFPANQSVTEKVRLHFGMVFGNLIDTSFTWNLSDTKMVRLPHAYKEWERYL